MMAFQLSWQDDSVRPKPRVRWAYCANEEDARELAVRLRQYDDVSHVELLANPDRADVRRVTF